MFATTHTRSAGRPMRHPLFVLASLLLAGAAASCASVASPGTAAGTPTPAAASTPAARPAPAAENTGPNTSILRRASGQYRYETISDGRVRGEEHWHLLVHPDGSRTKQIWHDLAARNAQFQRHLAVADNFRPLEAFVSYWNGGAFKGSAHFRVDGAKLLADSAGPYGTRNETIDVPEKFSIGTHPVAGDGWHTWTVIRTRKACRPARSTLWRRALT